MLAKGSALGEHYFWGRRFFLFPAPRIDVRIEVSPGII
jgi:hypothetical protein